MCILYFATFDHLHDVLVLDQFVHLHFVDDFMGFEMFFIGCSSKKLIYKHVHTVFCNI